LERARGIKETKAAAKTGYTSRLRVLADSAEEQTAIWKRLYGIQNDAWRAANWIASGQFLNDQLVR
jgi:hypothetical protein